MNRITEFAPPAFLRNSHVQTDFPDLTSYLRGYAITGEALGKLTVPSTLIASQDDPLIPASDIGHLASPAVLCVETPRLGGHCGFVMNRQLESWADYRMAEILESSSGGDRNQAGVGRASLPPGVDHSRGERHA